MQWANVPVHNTFSSLEPRSSWYQRGLATLEMDKQKTTESLT